MSAAPLSVRPFLPSALDARDNPIQLQEPEEGTDPLGSEPRSSGQLENGSCGATAQGVEHPRPIRVRGSANGRPGCGVTPQLAYLGGGRDASRVVFTKKPMTAGRRCGGHRPGHRTERPSERSRVPRGCENRYPQSVAFSAEATCAIYVRISQDRSGEELGVERQQRECQELATRLGLHVVRVYVDNDISATSGARRPAFEEMLMDRPRSVVAWHQDRLLRLTSDLEKVIQLEIPVHMVTAGSLDLSTPSGRAVARTVAAWSQFETEQKALRQRASNRQAAANGYWQFSLRPFGYERVNGDIVAMDAEAKLVRDGYRCVLRGDSYRSVARRWNRLIERWDTPGFRPVMGGTWASSRVQRLLENSHYAGIVTYQGEVVELAPGKSPQWTPLITEETWRAFRELKLARKTKRSWAVSPKHLLSGLLECGVCGGTLYSHAQDQTTRKGAADAGKARLPVFDAAGRRVKHTTYVCVDKHCVSIRAEYVDALVGEVISLKLSDPRVVQALRTTEDSASLEAEIADLHKRRDDLTDMIGDGLIPRERAREKLNEIAERLQSALSRMERLRSDSPITDLMLSSSIPERWSALPVLARRRAIVRLGLKLTINAADKGKRTRDPITGLVQSERAWAMRRVAWNWDG